jgi:aminomethyltransferase
MVPEYHSQMTSSGERPRQTPLHAVHERLGATMTSFAGWQMPLRYTSETAEHLAVRRAAGLFDLSHMGEIMVTGPDAGSVLDYALVGNLSALTPGRARYTMICAPDGGVLDDLVVYRPSEHEFMVVANASNTATVYRELAGRAASVAAEVEVEDATDNYALIAIQGPAAAGILGPLTELDLSALKYYAGAFGDVAGRLSWVARTGYTGEDGFEVFCMPEDAPWIWDALFTAGGPAGLVPAGLAARDTLRLEAGMPLYGNELGPDVTPFEAGLGRVVKFDKPGEFVGREALAARAAEGPRAVLVGLTMESRRIPRHGYPVLAGGADRVGTVTSGAPSPTLGVPIAMAYLEPGDHPKLEVDIRGQAAPADLTDLPFYRRSK